MPDLAATFIPELDCIRIDIPGQGHRYTTLLTPDQAVRLAAAVKVALANREPSPRAATRKASR